MELISKESIIAAFGVSIGLFLTTKVRVLSDCHNICELEFGSKYIHFFHVLMFVFLCEISCRSAVSGVLWFDIYSFCVTVYVCIQKSLESA